MFCGRYEKGKGVYIPWEIGSHYQRRSHHGHAYLVMGALEGLLGLERNLETGASPLVEVSQHESVDGKFGWVGLVNHSGQNGTAFHKPVPISDVVVEFKIDKQVKGVRLLRAKEELEFKVKDGWGRFVVPRLEGFEIVLFEYN